LKDLPHRGHRVREHRNPNVRELIVGGSYRLIYRVLDKTVVVTAFIHVARDLERSADPS
jgi:plasmid stabilization system protein ParE